MTDGYCAYRCSSSGATGCCQPRVVIANTVTSIGMVTISITITTIVYIFKISIAILIMIFLQY